MPTSLDTRNTPSAALHTVSLDLGAARRLLNAVWASAVDVRSLTRDIGRLDRLHEVTHAFVALLDAHGATLPPELLQVAQELQAEVEFTEESLRERVERACSTIATATASATALRHLLGDAAGQEPFPAMPMLIAQASGQLYALRLDALSRIEPLRGRPIARIVVDGGQVPYVPLRQLLSPGASAPQGVLQSAVLIRSGADVAAIGVESVSGVFEVVSSAAGTSDHPLISAAGQDEGGRDVLLLDPPRLVAAVRERAADTTA